MILTSLEHKHLDVLFTRNYVISSMIAIKEDVMGILFFL